MLKLTTKKIDELVDMFTVIGKYISEAGFIIKEDHLVISSKESNYFISLNIDKTFFDSYEAQEESFNVKINDFITMIKGAKEIQMEYSDAYLTVIKDQKKNIKLKVFDDFGSEETKRIEDLEQYTKCKVKLSNKDLADMVKEMKSVSENIRIDSSDGLTFSTSGTIMSRSYKYDPIENQGEPQISCYAPGYLLGFAPKKSDGVWFNYGKQVPIILKAEYDGALLALAIGPIIEDED